MSNSQELLLDRSSNKKRQDIRGRSDRFEFKWNQFLTL